MIEICIVAGIAPRLTVIKKSVDASSAALKESVNTGINAEIVGSGRAGRRVTRVIRRYGKHRVVCAAKGTKLRFLKSYVVTRHFNVVIVLERFANRFIQRQRHGLRETSPLV